MSIYRFDQSMTGLLSCVYRSFQFKDFDVKLASNNSQASLFDECIEVTPNYIRMRKVILDEEERKKQSKSMNAQMA